MKLKCEQEIELNEHDCTNYVLNLQEEKLEHYAQCLCVSLLWKHNLLSDKSDAKPNFYDKTYYYFSIAW